MSDGIVHCVLCNRPTIESVEDETVLCVHCLSEDQQAYRSHAEEQSVAPDLPAAAAAPPVSEPPPRSRAEEQSVAPDLPVAAAAPPVSEPPPQLAAVDSEGEAEPAGEPAGPIAPASRAPPTFPPDASSRGLRYYAFLPHHGQGPVVASGWRVALRLLGGDWFSRGTGPKGFRDLAEAVDRCHRSWPSEERIFIQLGGSQ